MQCDECRARLLELVEGELRPATAALVQAHLETCNGCRAELEQWRHVRDAVATAPVPEPAAPHWDHFETRVMAHVREREAARAPTLGRWLAPAGVLAAVAVVVLLVGSATPSVDPLAGGVAVEGPALALAEIDTIADELAFAWAPASAWNVDDALEELDDDAMADVPVLLARGLDADALTEAYADTAAGEAAWLEVVETMDAMTFETFLDRLERPMSS